MSHFDLFDSFHFETAPDNPPGAFSMPRPEYQRMFPYYVPNRRRYFGNSEFHAVIKGILNTALDALFYFYYQLHSGIPALIPTYGDFDMTSYPTSPPI